MFRIHAYLDPSAWAKRYFLEEGSDHINTLFNSLLKPRPSHLTCSRIGISEVISVLNKHKNSRKVTQTIFNVAYAHFEQKARIIQLVSVTNLVIKWYFSGLTLLAYFGEYLSELLLTSNIENYDLSER